MKKTYLKLFNFSVDKSDSTIISKKKNYWLHCYFQEEELFAYIFKNFQFSIIRMKAF